MLALNFQIAWRFLLAKRKAMAMSLAGITFGVGFFIFAQAQTSGFERFFVQTILGVNGALRVQDRFQETVTSILARTDPNSEGFLLPLREGRSYVPGVANPHAITQALQTFQEVTGVSPVLRGDVRIASGFRAEEGRVLGIEPESYAQVSTLESQVVLGSLDDFARAPDGLLMGRRLAERLDARLGSFILLGHLGETHRFRLLGIFETGIDVYDKTHVFVKLGSARSLLHEPAEISYLQVSIRDPYDAPLLARHMESVLGHAVADWQERERSWLEVFRVLRVSSALTMMVILVIAGLGMFNTLAIIVFERAREIAILRSVGFGRSDILAIFLLQGLIVCAMGTGLGFVLGAGLTMLAENIQLHIRGIFATDHFIVEWSPWHYVYGGSVALVIVLVAALIPARRASLVEPGDVVRGAAG